MCQHTGCPGTTSWTRCLSPGGLAPPAVSARVLQGPRRGIGADGKLLPLVVSGFVCCPNVPGNDSQCVTTAKARKGWEGVTRSARGMVMVPDLCSS